MPSDITIRPSNTRRPEDAKANSLCFPKLEVMRARSKNISRLEGINIELCSNISLAALTLIYTPGIICSQHCRWQAMNVKTAQHADSNIKQNPAELYSYLDTSFEERRTRIRRHYTSAGNYGGVHIISRYNLFFGWLGADLCISKLAFSWAKHEEKQGAMISVKPTNH